MEFGMGFRGPTQVKLDELHIGKTYTFFGTVNGIQIPAEHLTKVLWAIEGDADAYSTVAYDLHRGTATLANLSSHPLTACWMPTVPPTPGTRLKVTLIGTYTGGAKPVAFQATKEWALVFPATTTWPKVDLYGDSVRVYLAPGGNQYTLTLQKKNTTTEADQGISMTTVFTSIAASGRIYGINLVRELVYTVKNKVVTKVASTNDAFYFDGGEFPYTEVYKIAKEKEKDVVEFNDTPDYTMGTLEEEADLVSYFFQARTYFFYDDEDEKKPPAERTHPVLLAYPLEWGYKAELKYNGNGFNISQPAVQPVSTIKSMHLPQWDNFIEHKITSSKAPSSKASSSKDVSSPRPPGLGKVGM
ncbi:hypothetical protein QBC46DRAFT_177099 [Diplogelasinospora grovesii]|uniref:Uncharacterized protein n=1 Tax=Diplogelasinospora grovesii TaxID=303347 RepID=A0AAN6S2U6_9PEZI|nr:hypothetical protein QBC46DRAFT_177099 [Diplogelasinospora grovesii]